ncbi:MAG: DNA-methyltransferase [Candidatus Neomarinimicrobiota bacterium]
MENNPKDIVSPLINNYPETPVGLTIDDLNKYLSAVQTHSDILLDQDRMSEGLFNTDCLNGLKRIPDESIDLIITEPPNKKFNIEGKSKSSIIQDYYDWNNNWLFEVKRVLKNTGSIYILTDWKHSSMYHDLLGGFFKVRSRIIWRSKIKTQIITKSWSNSISDIWFATKTDDYLFRGLDNINELSENNLSGQDTSDLWLDIPEKTQDFEKNTQMIYIKILKASSVSLNWVLDPFMSFGDVGVASKSLGRRFIGFEKDKDSLIIAMKRIDEN